MKKDILNALISLGIMFLVGGCVMGLLIIQTNPTKKTEKTIQVFSDTKKASTASTIKNRCSNGTQENADNEAQPDSLRKRGAPNAP
ncbi:MAG: hypothetical protein [Microvirus sp.]|nr:MAG: hypothetical protein [Microvirus sp.]